MDDGLEYQLRERIRELENALGLNDEVPRCLHLTPVQATILSLLMRRDMVRRDGIYDVLYGALTGREPPQPNTVQVHITKLRNQLRPHKISIDLLPGHTGTYTMGQKSKARVQALLDAQTEDSIKGIGQ